MAALKGILKNDIFFSFGILKEYISLHCKYAKPAMTYMGHRTKRILRVGRKRHQTY